MRESSSTATQRPATTPHRAPRTAHTRANRSNNQSARLTHVERRLAVERPSIHISLQGLQGGPSRAAYTRTLT
jgi:hypothetical protein